jgi:hypothetical protein
MTWLVRHASLVRSGGSRQTPDRINSITNNGVMATENQGNVVSFMSRHFVALACKYESLHADGTVFHQGTSLYSGFLMALHGHVFWVTAGHCLKEELDDRIDKGALRVTGGGFMDCFGHEATYHHMVPFTYEAHCAFYINEPENGLDFALLMIDDLQARAFAANGLVAISRKNWVHQSQLKFDFYRMLGIPADRVFPGKTADAVQVQQAMVAVERLSAHNIGTPPPGDDIPSSTWFVGRIDPGAEIKDIKGMSGGPIYGFRRDSSGKPLYHVVALQSRWWVKSRTIFGCSIPYFAEAVHRQMGDSIRRSRID